MVASSAELSAWFAVRVAGPIALVASVDREDDAALVERACRGDRNAEEAIYKRHVRYLGGMATRLLRSRADAEDVVQDTFVTAFARLSTLRDRTALKPWLSQIAVSFVRKKLRRRRLYRTLGLDTSLEDAPLDAMARDDQSAEVRSELARLDAALAPLPVSQRIAWMLRHVEGDALEEVAATCGCSLATVKRWIAAADARVRAEEPSR